jgi:hypothetical protein
MVFVADDFAAWLIAAVAEAGRRRLAEVILGSDLERALRQTAETAVGLTAADLRPDRDEADALALVVSQVFRVAMPDAPVGMYPSLLQALEAGIAAQLAPLDDRALTGTGQSSADVLGVPGEVLAEMLAGHLVREIVTRGSRGGPLFPLASQLNHDVTHPQGLRIADIVSRLEAPDLVPAGRWRVPPLPPLTGREVHRPDLMTSVVDLVKTRSKSRTPMAVGLVGTGGFGKTTLAKMLVHNAAVQARFPDGIIWVNLGEAVDATGLASRIATLCEQLTGSALGTVDPHQAGSELGRVLEDRRVLLVIDEVWSTTQSESFMYGGTSAVRLFITRQRTALPPDTPAVRIDAMLQQEARLLLLGGISDIPRSLTDDILDITGRWPVLLGLANGAARTSVQSGRSAIDALAEVHAALVEAGPTVLDIRDPDRRSAAVAVTMTASIARLADGHRDRYFELAVFGQSVEIPRAVLEVYWRYTGGMTSFQTHLFCQQLADQSLVSAYRQDDPGPRLILHDIVRAYLRDHVHGSLPSLNRAFLDAHRLLLPTANGSTAWWRFPPDQNYMWTWMATHLSHAGLSAELRHMLHHPEFLIGS